MVPPAPSPRLRVLVEVAKYAQAIVLAAAAALFVINALRFHAAMGAWETPPTVMAALMGFILLFGVARGFREPATGLVQTALRFLGPDGRDDSEWSTGDDIVWECDRREPPAPE